MMTANVDLNPLPSVIDQVPGARVQVLGERPTAALLGKFKNVPGVTFDTSRVDGTDGVPRLVEQLSEQQVLFGSGTPLLIPEAALIRMYESSRLKRPALETLLSTGARRFREGLVAPVTVSTEGTDRDIRLGLPSVSELKGFRIWDSYFTPSHSHPGADAARLIADIQRSMPAIGTGQIERLCCFAHVGIGTTTDPELEQRLRSDPKLVTRPIDRFPNLLIGMIQLNANDVRASLDAINRWIVDGPMRGVYFPGGGPGALACSHRNFNPLVERIIDVGGIIMQHTWFNSLGRQNPGASTPAELAELARRFPEQTFLCAHAGGEWQRGIRAAQSTENILVETSGFDPTAGFIEMAVRELGPQRIVFGSHLPSRSLGTELGKVIGAAITTQDKRLILGENFRRILRPLMDR